MEGARQQKSMYANGFLTDDIKTRLKKIEKLTDLKRIDEAVSFLNTIEYDIADQFSGKEEIFDYSNVLKDIGDIRVIIERNQGGMKMGLEHIALSLPTSA